MGDEAAAALGPATDGDRVGATAEDLQNLGLFGELEEKLDFGLFTQGDPRLGWLLNMSPSSFQEEECGNQIFSCVNLYFLSQDGSAFKARMPYFYSTKANIELEAYLRRRFEGLISKTKIVDKEDLDLRRVNGRSIRK